MSIRTVGAVYNWQGLEYASGVCPVALRITIKGKQKYHPIKIPLKIGTINVAEKKILGLTAIIPFSFEINSKTRERDWSADQTLPLYNNTLTFPILFQGKTANTNSLNLNSSEIVSIMIRRRFSVKSQ